MRITTRKLLRTTSAIFFVVFFRNVLHVAVKGLKKNKKEACLLSSCKPDRHHKNAQSPFRPFSQASELLWCTEARAPLLCCVNLQKWCTECDLIMRLPVAHENKSTLRNKTSNLKQRSRTIEAVWADFSRLCMVGHWTYVWIRICLLLWCSSWEQHPWNPTWANLLSSTRDLDKVSNGFKSHKLFIFLTLKLSYSTSTSVSFVFLQRNVNTTCI